MKQSPEKHCRIYAPAPEARHKGEKTESNKVLYGYAVDYDPQLKEKRRRIQSLPVFFYDFVLSMGGLKTQVKERLGSIQPAVPFVPAAWGEAKLKSAPTVTFFLMHLNTSCCIKHHRESSENVWMQRFPLK